MFVVLFTLSGHFDGMTTAKTTKQHTLMKSDKWGHRTPFDTLEEAKEAWVNYTATKEKQILKSAEEAFKRNPKKSVGEYLEAITKISSDVYNPVYYNLNQVKD